MYAQRVDILIEAPGLSMGSASPADHMAESAMSALRTAMDEALCGDRRCARELCATVIFEVQPIIARHEDLRRTVVHALLVAHAFKLLSRVFRALSGRDLYIVCLSDQHGPIAAPSCYEEVRDINCTLDPRWIARLSAEDPFIDRLCEMLTAGPAGKADPRGSRRIPLSAEQV
jgi:hypothetical protein